MKLKLLDTVKKLNQAIENTPFSEHKNIKEMYELSLETLNHCYLYYTHKINGERVFCYPEEVQRLIHNTKMLSTQLNGVEFPEYLCKFQETTNENIEKLK